MPIKTIFEPIYQTKIHFIFDTPKEKAYFYIRKQNLIPLDFENHWQKAGIMYGEDTVGDYFIILPDKKPTWTPTTIIAHEAFHVVAKVMRKKGIPLSSESEEAYNYLLTWVLQSLTDIFNNHRKKLKSLPKTDLKKSSTKNKKEVDTEMIKSEIKNHAKI